MVWQCSPLIGTKLELLVGLEPPRKLDRLDKLGIVTIAATVIVTIGQQADITVTQVVFIPSYLLSLDVLRYLKLPLIIIQHAPIMFSFGSISRISRPILPAYLVLVFHSSEIFSADSDN